MIRVRGLFLFWVLCMVERVSGRNNLMGRLRQVLVCRTLSVNVLTGFHLQKTSLLTTKTQQQRPGQLRRKRWQDKYFKNGSCKRHLQCVCEEIDENISPRKVLRQE